MLVEPVEEYVNDVESEPSTMWRSPFRAVLGVFLTAACGVPSPLWVTKRRFLPEKG